MVEFDPGSMLDIMNGWYEDGEEGDGEIPNLEQVTREMYVNFLEEECCHKVFEDKWGPAGCMELEPDEEHPGMRKFAFFGCASS